MRVCSSRAFLNARRDRRPRKLRGGCHSSSSVEFSSSFGRCRVPAAVGGDRAVAVEWAVLYRGFCWATLWDAAGVAGAEATAVVQVAGGAVVVEALAGSVAA